MPKPHGVQENVSTHIVVEENMPKPHGVQENVSTPIVVEENMPKPHGVQENVSTHIVVEENPEDYLRYYSNRYYLMNIVLLYFFAFFLRYQTSPGANHTEFALLCWRLYSR